MVQKTFTGRVIGKPVWSASFPTTLSLNSGEQYNFGQWASDPNSLTLTFSIISAPTGTTLVSASTGVIQTGTTGGSIVLRATNSSGLWTNSPTCTITIVTSTIRTPLSNSLTDVQTLINASTTVAGDTVRLIAGQAATWGSPGLTLSKAITLDGNGNNITKGYSSQDGLIHMNAPSSGQMRVTGFNFKYSAATSGFNKPYYINVNGSSSVPRWRIDHCDFATVSGGETYLTTSQVAGLIDHNTFTTSTNAEIIHQEGVGVSGWNYDVVPGSDDAVYIEDNTFLWTGGTAAGANAVLQNYYGNRTVFRHNTIYGGCVDVHGNTHPCGRWNEFYENDFYSSINMSVLFQIRGGSGVIFNNRLHNLPGANGGRGFDIYEDDTGASYPAIYQVGRGKNLVTNPTTGSQQSLDPMYIWNNTVINEGGGTEGMGVGVDGGLVQLNRDVYLSARPGYTAYQYPHPLQGGTAPSTPIIDPSRRIDWVAGVAGGIPTRTTVGVTVSADTTGQTDATSAINTAITNCPVGQVVYIPAGTYRLNSQIILKKGVTLRGAGTSTVLNSYANWHAIQMGDFPSPPVVTALQTNANKGDTSITVASVTNPVLAVGDYIVIDQTNDGVEVNNTPPDPDFSRDANNRSLSQMTKITAINGTTLSLDLPLNHSYQTTRTAQVWKVSTVYTGMGLEDLKIVRISPTTGGYSNIKVVACAGCWIKNIRSDFAEFRHVDLDRSYRNEIRDSHFHDGFNHASGGEAYGLVCGRNSSANLIENNIIYHCRHSMIIKEGASGNVYGYNYSVASWQGDGWLAGDIQHHGAHTNHNLFEGNMGAQIREDWTHGSSSYNTFFRNNVIRDSFPPENPSGATSGRRCVDVEKASTYINLVGNVLGRSGQTWDMFEDSGTRTPGSVRLVYTWGYDDAGASTAVDTQPKATAYRHGNFDYQSNSVIWDASNSNHTLPSSLYLTSAPSFFTSGGYTWPWVTPDQTTKTLTLPAKARYEAGG